VSRAHESLRARPGGAARRGNLAHHDPDRGGRRGPATLLAHFIRAAELALDPIRPGFSAAFPSPAEIDAFWRETYTETHRRYAEAQPGTAALLE
jgi:hypothetical protein